MERKQQDMIPFTLGKASRNLDRYFRHQIISNPISWDEVGFSFALVWFFRASSRQTSLRHLSEDD